jgi:hypothetical protein
VPDELEQYAATIAPRIDRLFIAGHRSARVHTRQIRESLEPESLGVLIDLRIPLLAHGGMAFSEARAIQRYLPPTHTRTGLDDQQRLGTLSVSGGQWFPSPRGTRILAHLTAALEQGTSELWSRYIDDCERAITIAAVVILTARTETSCQRFPAFHAVNPCLDATSPIRLWLHLAMLRYLRADAHAIAWSDAGLDAVGAIILTHLCHSQTPTCVEQIERIVSESPCVRAALSRLEGLGWIVGTGGRWEATESGRNARASIEEATNDINCTFFRVLPREHRLDLLALLDELPST